MLHRPPETPLGVRIVLYDRKHLAQGGAVIGSVDHGCVAWRAGIRIGDVISAIQIDALGERVTVSDGYQATRLLTPAHGAMTLTIRRRRWKETDYAAQKVQAVWRGAVVRAAFYDLSRAARVLQAGWRHYARKRPQSAAHPRAPLPILSPPRLDRFSSGSSLDAHSLAASGRASSGSNFADSSARREPPPFSRPTRAEGVAGEDHKSASDDESVSEDGAPPILALARLSSGSSVDASRDVSRRDSSSREY
jgi:hypothetical protein